VKGFTFVEILVVLAVMAIIVAISMQSMVQYGQRQQYRQFAQEVTDGISEARAKTIAGIGDTTYGVYVSEDTIEFYSGATPTIGDPANTIITVPSYINATSTLTGGIQFLTFTRLTGVPSAVGTIEIGHRRAAATTTLTIYESGLVQ
jgi:prepilin-type N-terminal cleavage/methylation domain-containing protein